MALAPLFPSNSKSGLAFGDRDGASAKDLRRHLAWVTSRRGAPFAKQRRRNL
jgi:hypothetical protein